MKNVKVVAPLLAALVIALVWASAASADGTVSWGVSGVTPTLDTANGDHNDAATPNVTDSSACPDGITCGPEVNPLSGTNPILPGPFLREDTANAPHSGEDLGVWNPSVTAPDGGQVLAVNVTGCAVKDPGATQASQGVPDNTVLFQSLTPVGSDWQVDNTAGGESPDGTYPFQLPFCQSPANPSGVPATTVTTFQPVHLCVNAGDVVTFHDIGGFEDDNGVAYYPQGIPMEVLAAQPGVGTDSFIGVGANPLGPGLYGAGNETDMSGFATEADQEVTMQVVEGTGNDAYGLCPGGFGDEPADSNAIDCDFRTSADGTSAANPVQYPDHPFCANAGQPIPGSNLPGYTTTIPPTIKSDTSPTPHPITSTSSSSSKRPPEVTAPVLTKLKSNPARFVAKRGSTVTYTDSHPGLTTLRFYLVKGKKQVLKRTIRHQDKANVGFHLGGLGPGSYVIEASSVYNGLHSETVTAKFKVVVKR